MKLKDYLKAVDKTTDEFAAEIGVSGAAVRRYCNGERVPKRTVLVRIRSVTRGKVTANDFVDDEPGRRAA